MANNMDYNMDNYMDNNDSTEVNPVYDYYYATPDTSTATTTTTTTTATTQQPVTAQPTSKAELEPPIIAADARPGSHVDKHGADRKERAGKLGDKVYPAGGEQGKREWTSDLFYSLTGKPQNRSPGDNFKQAMQDGWRVPCMMCSIARRLGDPPYLPFLPCTGTALRFKVRILGEISGSLSDDCLVTSCCWACAVCQMHRELEEIGI